MNLLTAVQRQFGIKKRKTDTISPLTASTQTKTDEDTEFTSEKLHNELIAKIKAKFPNRSVGKILHPFTDDQKNRYPDIEGTCNLPALQEIHIFLACLFPDTQQVNDYEWICEAFCSTYESTHPRFKQMKAPRLALYYRTKNQYVTVLQSSRYILSNNKQHVIEETLRDAALFTAAGFDVIRLKIECSMHGVLGIPENGNQMESYFENHIRVKQKPGFDLTSENEISELNAISKKFSKSFGIPIPLSYNLNKRGQRYLNTRFRKIGRKRALDKVRAVKEYVKDNSSFVVDKSIDEMIVCDSFTAMDEGWIDFTDDELAEFHQSLDCYDTVIVGMGPSGLAYLNTLARTGKLTKTLIIEGGPKLNDRGRYHPYSSIAGMGGAGLYSDGKFSLFPAGHALYELGDEKTRRQELLYLQNILDPFLNISDAMKACDAQPGDSSPKPISDSWHLKKYPSEYINLENRKTIINRLYDSFSESPEVKSWFNCIVTAIDPLKSEKGYKLLTTNGAIKASKVILAGGRFCPLLLNNFSTSMVFRRYEFGIRIAGSKSNPIFSKFSHLLDPKITFTVSKNEYRTFCWIREGEYFVSNYNGIQSYSGRSDLPEPSTFSNIGFNIRLNEKQIPSFDSLKLKPFKYSFQQLEQQPADSLLGKMCIGVKKLASILGDEIYQCEFIGPVIEGIGLYPAVDDSLQIKGESMYALGDCSGIFRGLVPALLSGIKVGLIHS